MNYVLEPGQRSYILIRTRDTLGATLLSLVERLSLSQVKHGAATSVLCREVVPISEGPLSEAANFIQYVHIVDIPLSVGLWFCQDSYASSASTASSNLSPDSGEGAGNRVS